MPSPRPAVTAVGLALALTGLFSWRWEASASTRRPDDARTVWLGDCATCHGADGKGTDRGPSLEPFGPSGVSYALTTGRMPIDDPAEVPQRRAPHYPPETIGALVELSRQLLPGSPDLPSLDTSAADVARGDELYRLNCAACHAWSGGGGALLRRNAPSVHSATPDEVAQAVRLGPGTMPRFGPDAVPDGGLVDLAAYVGTLAHPRDEGGWAMWHIGPLAEGAAVFVVAGILVAVALRRIGERHAAERSPG